MEVLMRFNLPTDQYSVIREAPALTRQNLGKARRY
jgi:hypothetical protein